MYKSNGWKKALSTNNVRRHGCNSLLSVLGICFLFEAIRQLTLADAVVLSFAEGIFLVLFFVFFHKEHIGLRRCFLLFLGLTGVVIVAKPTGNIFNWGSVFAVLSALCEALFVFNCKTLRKTDSDASIMIYATVLNIIFCASSMVFVWVFPTPKDWMLLFFIGILNGYGHYYSTISYYYAPSNLIAPLSYITVVWAVLYDIFFLSHVPETSFLIGATLIIGSSIYGYSYSKRNEKH